MDDLALLRAYVERGDVAALSALIQKHQRGVFLACWRKLRSVADAEDASQEVFVALVEQSETVHSNVGAWLHRCAMNVANGMLRSRRNRLRWELEKVTGQGQEAATEDLVLRERMEILEECLRTMDAEDHRLLVDNCVDGSNQQKIAAQRGVSQQTISKRLTRIMRQLRAGMTARGVVGSLVAAVILAARRKAYGTGLLRMNLWVGRWTSTPDGVRETSTRAVLGVKVAAAVAIVLAASSGDRPSPQASPGLRPAPAALADSAVPQLAAGGVDGWAVKIPAQPAPPIQPRGSAPAMAPSFPVIGGAGPVPASNIAVKVDAGANPGETALVSGRSGSVPQAHARPDQGMTVPPAKPPDTFAGQMGNGSFPESASTSLLVIQARPRAETENERSRANPRLESPPASTQVAQAHATLATDKGIGDAPEPRVNELLTQAIAGARRGNKGHDALPALPSVTITTPTAQPDVRQMPGNFGESSLESTPVSDLPAALAADSVDTPDPGDWMPPAVALTAITPLSASQVMPVVLPQMPLSSALRMPETIDELAMAATSGGRQASAGALSPQPEMILFMPSLRSVPAPEPVSAMIMLPAVWLLARRRSGRGEKYSVFQA